MRILKFRKMIFYFSSIVLFNTVISYNKTNIKNNYVSALNSYSNENFNYLINNKRDEEIEMTIAVQGVYEQIISIQRNYENLDIDQKNLELKKLLDGSLEEFKQMFNNLKNFDKKNINLKALNENFELFNDLINKIKLHQYSKDVQNSFSNYKTEIKSYFQKLIDDVHCYISNLFVDFNTICSNMFSKAKVESFKNREDFDEFYACFVKFVSLIENCGVNLTMAITESYSNKIEKNNSINLYELYKASCYKNKNEEILKKNSEFYKNWSNLNYNLECNLINGKFLNFSVDENFIKLTSDSKRLFKQFDCYYKELIKKSNKKNKLEENLRKIGYFNEYSEKFYINRAKKLNYVGTNFLKQFDLLKKINEKNIEFEENVTDSNFNLFIFFELKDFIEELLYVSESFDLIDKFQVQLKIVHELKSLSENIDEFLNNRPNFHIHPGIKKIITKFKILVRIFQQNFLNLNYSNAEINKYGNEIFEKNKKKLDELLNYIKKINALSYLDSCKYTLDDEKIEFYLNSINLKFNSLKHHLLNENSEDCFRNCGQILKEISNRFKNVINSDNNQILKKIDDFVILCEATSSNSKINNDFILVFKKKALLLNDNILPALKNNNLNCLNDLQDLIYDFQILVKNAFNYGSYNSCNVDNKYRYLNLYFEVFRILFGVKYNVYGNFFVIENFLKDYKKYDYDQIENFNEIKNEVNEDDDSFISNLNNLSNLHKNVIYIFENILNLKDDLERIKNLKYRKLDICTQNMEKDENNPKNQKLMELKINFDNYNKKINDLNTQFEDYAMSNDYKDKNQHLEEIEKSIKNFDTIFERFFDCLERINSDKIIQRNLKPDSMQKLIMLNKNLLHDKCEMLENSFKKFNKTY